MKRDYRTGTAKRSISVTVRMDSEIAGRIEAYINSNDEFRSRSDLIETVVTNFLNTHEGRPDSLVEIKYSLENIEQMIGQICTKLVGDSNGA